MAGGSKEKDAILKIWDTTPEYIFDLSDLSKIVTKKQKCFQFLPDPMFWVICRRLQRLLK